MFVHFIILDRNIDCTTKSLTPCGYISVILKRILFWWQLILPLVSVGLIVAGHTLLHPPPTLLCFFVMTWDKHETSLHLFRIHWKQVCGILVMQSWKVKVLLCTVLTHLPKCQQHNWVWTTADMLPRYVHNIMCCLKYGKTHLKHYFRVFCLKSDVFIN